MPNSDIPCTYRTLAEPGQAEFKDKGSRFIAFAYPVRTAAEVKSHVDALRQEHHKARHWCYAYRFAPTTTANLLAAPAGRFWARLIRPG